MYIKTKFNIGDQVFIIKQKDDIYYRSIFDEVRLSLHLPNIMEKPLLILLHGRKFQRSYFKTQ